MNFAPFDSAMSFFHELGINTKAQKALNFTPTPSLAMAGGSPSSLFSPSWEQYLSSFWGGTGGGGAT